MNSSSEFKCVRYMPKAQGILKGGGLGLVHVSSLVRYYRLVSVPAWGIQGATGGTHLGGPPRLSPEILGRFCVGPGLSLGRFTVDPRIVVGRCWVDSGSTLAVPFAVPPRCRPLQVTCQCTWRARRDIRTTSGNAARGTWNVGSP